MELAQDRDRWQELVGMVSFYIYILDFRIMTMCCLMGVSAVK
jgi:hypothetical protein